MNLSQKLSGFAKTFRSALLTCSRVFCDSGLTEHLINFHRFFVAPDKEALDAAGIQLKEMGLHVNFMIYCCALLIFLPILILLYCTFTFIGLDEMP